MYTVRVPN